MVFSIFTAVCNHPHYLILEPFHHPQKRPVPVSSHSLPFPQPPLTTELLSVSVDLLILDIACKRDPTTCGLVSGFFAQRHVCEVRPHRSTYQRFVPFLRLRNIPPCGRTTLRLPVPPFVAIRVVSHTLLRSVIYGITSETSVCSWQLSSPAVFSVLRISPSSVQMLLL